MLLLELCRSLFPWTYTMKILDVNGERLTPTKRFRKMVHFRLCVNKCYRKTNIWKIAPEMQLCLKLKKHTFFLRENTTNVGASCSPRNPQPLKVFTAAGLPKSWQPFKVKYAQTKASAHLNNLVTHGGETTRWNDTHLRTYRFILRRPLLHPQMEMLPPAGNTASRGRDGWEHCGGGKQKKDRCQPKLPRAVHRIFFRIKRQNLGRIRGFAVC